MHVWPFLRLSAKCFDKATMSPWFSRHVISSVFLRLVPHFPPFPLQLTHVLLLLLLQLSGKSTQAFR